MEGYNKYIGGNRTMVLNKTANDNQAKVSGFTIVELLIVIVVIGILAAITIVSYSGITNRANGTQAITNAESVQKVGEAYNADPPAGVNGYPALFSNLSSYNGSAKLPSGIVLTDAATAPTAANGKTNITYAIKATGGGGCVGFWNFTTSAINYVTLGSATGLPAGGPFISCS